MYVYALLFARSIQAADDSALLDWKWDKVGDLGRHEYRRPDTGERIRFMPDHPDCIRGLRWGTRIYCGRNWTARLDAMNIRALIGEGFFVEIDPEMPPPRPRPKRDRILSEVREQLARLENKS